MPIDVSLIRAIEEGGILDEVKKWQVARITNNNNDSARDKPSESTNDENTKARVQEFMLSIHGTEKNKRLLLREVTATRTRINRLQKCIAPKRKNGKKEIDSSSQPSSTELDSARDEIRQLKSLLPSISDKLELISTLLDEQLVQLGNVLDTTCFPIKLDLDDFNKKRGMSVVRDLGYSISDPLFCIGGCEPMILPDISAISENVGGGVTDINDNNAKSKGKYVLTYIGCEILTSLMRYGRQYLSSKIMQNVSFVTLPESLAIPRSLAHAIFGCSKQLLQSDETRGDNSACRFCNVSHCQAPSYIGVALMNQNKSFSDRMLPSMHLIQTSARSEQTRFAHQLERIDMLALTVSNTIISRELQDDIASAMLSFYASLLSNTQESKQKIALVTSSKESPLRVRIVKASDLDFNECRRVVVEGFLPSKGVHIELAHVSNSTDYISRHFKIKCGGSNAHNVEYVHMLHGTMLQESAIDWMLENNIANDDDQYQGIMIPAVLGQLFEFPKMAGTVWLPFIRNLLKGKAGKVKVNEVKSVPNPIICDADNMPVEGTLKTANEKKNMAHSTMQANYPIMNIQEARAEALCNPYDFLPLFK